MKQKNGSSSLPMLFLAGPPGSGKTSLGSRACVDLGLRFLDLATVIDNASGVRDARSLQGVLEEVIQQRASDVVELPWPLQLTRGTFALCRRHGQLIGLWAHPLDMQMRSGHTEPLFKPNPRIKTRGGFGLRGTRCVEFIRIDRACEAMLITVGLSFEDSLAELKATMAELLAEATESPTDHKGLSSWADYWQLDLGADKEAAETLANAMACYTRHLKSEGVSPRTMSAKYDDLNSLGHLVLAYDAPEGKGVLNSLWSHTIEYSRKISDSPKKIARYKRTVENFRRFLRENGWTSNKE